MLFTINTSPFLARRGQVRYIPPSARPFIQRNWKEPGAKGFGNPNRRTRTWFMAVVFSIYQYWLKPCAARGMNCRLDSRRLLSKPNRRHGKCEPIETLIVDVPGEVAGKVIELVTQRKGDLLVMEPKGDLPAFNEFDIPARGIIGIRNNVLTATGGEAIMAHRFKAYEPWKGAIPGRLNGVLVSMDAGKTTAFAIDKLQDRGRFHIDPGSWCLWGARC